MTGVAEFKLFKQRKKFNEASRVPMNIIDQPNTNPTVAIPRPHRRDRFNIKPLQRSIERARRSAYVSDRPTPLGRPNKTIQQHRKCLCCPSVSAENDSAFLTLIN